MESAIMCQLRNIYCPAWIDPVIKVKRLQELHNTVNICCVIWNKLLNCSSILGTY